MDYETVIGLEVHVQLNTCSKLFCRCPTTFGMEPNTQACPVCLGLPGVLPVLNAEALKKALTAALALNCTIVHRSIFARKNYFYPDLPKDYQVSMYEQPLSLDGYLKIPVDGGPKRIEITRVHLEEDAGKLIHSPEEEGMSYVDMNRSGVPLIEIVSEPDIRSPEEATAYLQELKNILRYVDVSDCNMEEGSLRCDANLSVRPAGEEKFGVKTEVKNMNSFKAVNKALIYERERQIELLKSDGEVIQETRLYDADRGITISMREKEEAYDYRYFPEPDLLPIVLTPDYIDSLREELPELPAQKRLRFQEDYGLPLYDAGVLTQSREMAHYYERTVDEYEFPKKISNWIMSEVMRVLNEKGIGIDKFNVPPEAIAGILRLIDSGEISGKIAKTVFEEMVNTGKPPEVIVRERGLTQVTDRSEIERVAEEVIGENPDTVASYIGGKTKALSYLVGQLMKKTKGRANPRLANEVLREKISLSGSTGDG